MGAMPPVHLACELPMAQSLKTTPKTWKSLKHAKSSEENNALVGGLEHSLFSHIVETIIPIA